MLAFTRVLEPKTFVQGWADWFWMLAFTRVLERKQVRVMPSREVMDARVYAGVGTKIVFFTPWMLAFMRVLEQGSAKCL
jgi:hypothetical protein